jgi:hypothetical protein
VSPSVFSGYIFQILACTFEGGLFLSNISARKYIKYLYNPSMCGSFKPSHRKSCGELSLEENVTKAIHIVLMCSSVKRKCCKSHVKPSLFFLKTSQSPSKTVAAVTDVVGKPEYLSLKFSGTKCIQNPMLRSLICSPIKKRDRKPACGDISVFSQIISHARLKI